jgi:hypothetical protein
MEEKKIEEIEKKTEKIDINEENESKPKKNTPKLQSLLHSSYNEGKKNTKKKKNLSLLKIHFFANKR